MCSGCSADVSEGTNESCLEGRWALRAVENLGPEGSDTCQSHCLILENTLQRAVTPGMWRRHPHPAPKQVCSGELGMRLCEGGGCVCGGDLECGSSLKLL